MNTQKDAEILAWIGCLGAAGAEHVMDRFEMGRSWAYGRLSSLVDDGLLEKRQLLHQRPGLYTATAQGLRWQGLERLGVCRVRPGAFEHAWELASVEVALHQTLPDHELLGERMLRAREREEAQLIASAPVGQLPGGVSALHRPDLVAIGPAEAISSHRRVIAIEVELSVKAPVRLAAITRAYARARHLDHVYYLASAPAQRALLRAIKQTRSEQQITVLHLDQAAQIADLQCKEAMIHA